MYHREKVFDSDSDHETQWLVKEIKETQVKNNRLFVYYWTSWDYEQDEYSVSTTLLSLIVVTSVWNFGLTLDIFSPIDKLSTLFPCR